MGTNGGVKEGLSEVSGVLTTEQSILERIIEEAANKQPALIPTDHEWDVYESMAKMAAGTPFYGKLGGPNGIMAIMLYAREIGMPPMSALNGGIDNIMGRLSISARSVNEKIRLSGHQIQVKSISDKECTVWGKRKDTGEEMTATYTLEDAKRAGLFKSGGGYERNPQDMMFARGITRLGRRLFPDVIKGAHIEGEPSEFDHPEQEQPQEQKPATITEMMKNKPAQVQQAEQSREQEPLKIETPKQEPLTEPEPSQIEQPQEQNPEPPKADPPKENGNSEEQRKARGRSMLLDKLSKFHNGDVDKINASLAESLPNNEIKPDMDNLSQFSLTHLQDINKYITKLTSETGK